MKLNEKAFANAFGALAALFFVGCYILILVSPGLYKAIMESWLHALKLSGLWESAPKGFLLGLISFTIVSWSAGWLFAWVYNKLSK